MSAGPGRGWFCPKCLQRFPGKLDKCPADGWPPVEDLAGTQVAGRYGLEKLIGVGGMGSSVWRAKQTAMGRTVAIKLLPPTGTTPGQRFAREAHIASNLNHPHIVVVHDYGETEDGKLFLVMENLEGTTLQHEIKRTPILPVDRVLRIADQTLRALEHAHLKYVVHRDLKPGNLFLVNGHEGDFVKVLDFGLAKYVEDASGEGEGGVPHDMDVTGQRPVVCGTPNYMSPEQLLTGKVDARTDLYALGVVMYRLLTGRLPYVSDSSYELYRQIIQNPVPAFDVLAGNSSTVQVPDALQDVVRRSLGKRPEDRYASAKEMRVALREVRYGLGVLSGDHEDVILLDSRPSPQPATPVSVAGPGSVASVRSLSVPRSAVATRPKAATTGRWIALAAVGVVVGGVGVFFATRSPPTPAVTPAPSAPAPVPERAPVAAAAVAPAAPAVQPEPKPAVAATAPRPIRDADGPTVERRVARGIEITSAIVITPPVAPIAAQATEPGPPVAGAGKVAARQVTPPKTPTAPVTAPPVQPQPPPVVGTTPPPVTQPVARKVRVETLDGGTVDSKVGGPKPKAETPAPPVDPTKKPKVEVLKD